MAGRELFRRHPDLRKELWGGELWTCSLNKNLKIAVPSWRFCPEKNQFFVDEHDYGKLNFLFGDKSIDGNAIRGFDARRR